MCASGTKTILFTRHYTVKNELTHMIHMREVIIQIEWNAFQKSIMKQNIKHPILPDQQAKLTPCHA